MIVFHKDMFGADTHLLFDKGFSWTEDIPVNSWVYSTSSLPNDLSDFCSTWNYEIADMIPQKYRKMMEHIGEENPQWYNILGAKKFKKSMKVLLDDVGSFISMKKNHRYISTYRKQQEFLWSLKPTPADGIRFRSLHAMDVSLPGFDLKNGHFPVVRYDRRTKTGRLRVVSGPSILTLKSEHRNVAKGCRQIDFQNMEPRLLLAFTGKFVDGDLYEKIQKDLNIKGDRTYIKVSIISSMYGSRVVPEIADYFALNEWVNQLENQITDGWIENYFGRPIQCGKVRGKHLLALWLQSSAADAALIGFEKFFSERKDLIPHWVIHDACIFSGMGETPNYLQITPEIKLPIVCTEV